MRNFTSEYRRQTSGGEPDDTIFRKYQRPPPDENSEVVGEYLYQDENCQPYLQVLRYKPKAFSQWHWEERPGQKGHWVSGKPKGPKIPYFLPQIIKSSNETPIFVCEGEGNADDVMDLGGLVATSASEGAGKWTSDLNRWFAHRRVFILQDNDEAGRRHALMAARNLLSVAAEVRIVKFSDVAEKGDVSDWLKAGHSKDDLIARCEAAEIYRGTPETDAEPLPTVKHGDPITPMRWLVRNRIPETGAGLLVGQWGVYKSFMALDIAASVMTGWDWTGEKVYRRGGVLIFAAEGAGGLGLRVAALAEHRIAASDPSLSSQKQPIEWTSGAPTLLGTGQNDPLPVLAATAAAADRRFQEKFGLSLALIVIDTVAACAGWRDENDNAEASRVMAVLRNLSWSAQCAVLGIDHAGKNAELGTRGASAKEANSDFILSILGDKQQNGEVADTRLALRKMRDGPQGMEIPFGAKLVDMGHDERGEPVTSRVIDWGVTRAPRKPAFNASAQAFEDALSNALKAHGAVVTLNGVERFAVDRDRLRDAFRLAYKPDAELETSARDERFRKALKEAKDGYRVAIFDQDKEQWIWRVVPM